jgi:hypothetical protein
MEIIVPPEDQFCKIGGKKADESCHLAENRVDLPKSAVLHVAYFTKLVKKKSDLSICYLNEKHFYA